MEVLCIVALLLPAVAGHDPSRPWEQRNPTFPGFGGPQPPAGRPNVEAYGQQRARPEIGTYLGGGGGRRLPGGSLLRRQPDTPGSPARSVPVWRPDRSSGRPADADLPWATGGIEQRHWKGPSWKQEGWMWPPSPMASPPRPAAGRGGRWRGKRGGSRRGGKGNMKDPSGRHGWIPLLPPGGEDGALFDGTLLGGRLLRADTVDMRELIPIFKADNVTFQNATDLLSLREGENVFLLPRGGRGPPHPKGGPNEPQRMQFGFPNNNLQPYLKLVYNPTADKNKISFEYGIYLSLLG